MIDWMQANHVLWDRFGDGHIKGAFIGAPAAGWQDVYGNASRVSIESLAKVCGRTPWAVEQQLKAIQRRSRRGQRTETQWRQLLRRLDRIQLAKEPRLTFRAP